MATGYFTGSQVASELKDDIGAGSQVEYAAGLDISPQLLSDILACRRKPTKEILKRLGFVKSEQLYLRVGKR